MPLAFVFGPEQRRQHRALLRTRARWRFRLRGICGRGAWCDRYRGLRPLGLRRNDGHSRLQVPGRHARRGELAALCGCRQGHQ